MHVGRVYLGWSTVRPYMYDIYTNAVSTAHFEQWSGARIRNILGYCFTFVFFFRFSVFCSPVY